MQKYIRSTNAYKKYVVRDTLRKKGERRRKHKRKAQETQEKGTGSQLVASAKEKKGGKLQCGGQVVNESEMTTRQERSGDEEERLILAVM